MNNGSILNERSLALLTIGSGGFLGATSRFVLAGYFRPSAGTLAVNVLGSILLGFLMYNSEYLGYVSPRTRMFFGIGFMGSFTTFSTFSLQTFQMPWNMAIFNIVANIMLTLAGVFAGRGAVVYLVNLRGGATYTSSDVSIASRRYASYMTSGIIGVSILFLPVMGGISGLWPEILLVGAGALLGAPLRFMVSGAIPRIREIPAGTLAVNLIGSFVLASLTFSSVSGSLAYFMSAGMLGSFTTFSTFAYETFRLLDEGEGSYSLLNILLNVVLCLIVVAAAYLLFGSGP